MNQSPATPLPDADATNCKARDLALARLVEVPIDVTGVVNYGSSGRLLVAGENPQAVERALDMAHPLRPAALLVGSGRAALRGVTTWWAGRGEIRLSGWLGDFRLRLDGRGDEEERFDLVLDLTGSPLIDSELPPPGYRSPGAAAEAVDAALREMQGLVGEFEKPRYFEYDPEICAHGMKGATACRRCIEACAAGAISSLVDRVLVEPFLCQGGGACATACPTGAMTYSYPSVGDTLERVRRLLAVYRDAGGESPLLVIHDVDEGSVRVRALLDGAARGHLLPLPLEEVASLGLEAWLSALAYGARAVRILDTPVVPESSRREVSEQLEFGRTILAGLGYPQDALSWLDEAPEPAAPVMPDLRPASHAAVGGKRQILFAAVDHLSTEAKQARPLVELPAGAPFGTAAIDEKSCTLCMACVTVCPGKALQDGHDVPQLRFLEANCVQCGLCARSCPEDAIWISPRFLFDPERRGGPRVLREDSPFHCVSCGEPFGTTSVIGCMQQRLAGHAMYQRERERRRLQMCGDCRVADMMREQEI